MMIDVDSTICEVAGKAKRGAALRLHEGAGLPPAAGDRADTGEVLHARMRKGSANTQRGAGRFIDRTRRPGAARRRQPASS